jgi:Arc/MetJ-type ribon-helix-helix transcriptional regulator
MKRSKQRGNADLDSPIPKQYSHGMTAAKIAISIDPEVLERIDSLVRDKKFRSRSEVFQTAVAEQLFRLSEHSLAVECEKLDAAEEQAFADMGLSSELIEWPEY